MRKEYGKRKYTKTKCMAKLDDGKICKAPLAIGEKYCSAHKKLFEEHDEELRATDDIMNDLELRKKELSAGASKTDLTQLIAYAYTLLESDVKAWMEQRQKRKPTVHESLRQSTIFQRYAVTIAKLWESQKGMFSDPTTVNHLTVSIEGVNAGDFRIAKPVKSDKDPVQRN